MATTTWAPCSNGATPYRARGGNFVGAGKRFPVSNAVVTAQADCLTLEAADQGSTLVAPANPGSTPDDQQSR